MGIIWQLNAHIAVLLATYLTAIVLHELGHWIILDSKTRPAHIVFGRQENGKIALRTESPPVPPGEEVSAIMMGIIIGALPYIIAGMFNTIWLVFSLFYINGLIPDIKRLWTLRRQR